MATDGRVDPALLERVVDRSFCLYRRDRGAVPARSAEWVGVVIETEYLCVVRLLDQPAALQGRQLLVYGVHLGRPGGGCRHDVSNADGGHQRELGFDQLHGGRVALRSRWVGAESDQ